MWGGVGWGVGWVIRPHLYPSTLIPSTLNLESSFNSRGSDDEQEPPSSEKKFPSFPTIFCKIQKEAISPGKTLPSRCEHRAVRKVVIVKGPLVTPPLPGSFPGIAATLGVALKWFSDPHRVSPKQSELTASHQGSRELRNGR